MAAMVVMDYETNVQEPCWNSHWRALVVCGGQHGRRGPCQAELYVELAQLAAW